MPRINSIIFSKIGLKLSYFCQKKFFFECWGIRPPHPMPPVAGGLAPKLQLPPVVGGSTPRPRNASPHRRFLATRLHEEIFTARYCRHPFVLAFMIIIIIIFIYLPSDVISQEKNCNLL